jgi:hypothetical protein
MILEDKDIEDYIKNSDIIKLAGMLVDSLRTWNEVEELIRCLQDNLPEATQ